MKRIYRLFFTAAALLAIAPLANAQYGEYSINGQIKDTDGSILKWPKDTGLQLPENSEFAYSKNISSPQSNGTYWIKLESFATGSATYIESAAPADIVLVLDVSSSMCSVRGNKSDYYIDVDFVSNHMNTSNGGNEPFTYTNIHNNENNLYYLAPGAENNETNRRPVRAESHENRYYLYYLDADGRTRHYLNVDGSVVTPAGNRPSSGVSGASTRIYNGVLIHYRRQQRIDALRTAVNAFIDVIDHNDQYEDETNDHPRTGGRLGNRISIITFASANDVTVLNNLNVGSLENGKAADLKNKVNQARLYSGTRQDEGLKAANLQFKNYVDALRMKVSSRTVVLFTDGDPYAAGIDDSVLYNNAISATLTAKTKDNPETTDVEGYDATVFTVGLFSQTYGENSDIWKFMNYASSNAPKATNMSTPGAGFNKNAGYYKDATSETVDLTAVFTEIARQSGGSKTALSAASPNVDVISSSFVLPPNTDATNIQNVVKIFVAKLTNITADGKYEFEEEYMKDHTPATYTYYELDKNGDRVSDTPKKVDAAISVSLKGADEIKVTGFDYGSCFCGPVYEEGYTPTGTAADRNHIDHYQGYKIMILIPIKMNPEAVGGPNVNTNGEGSGIFLTDGDKTAYVEYVSPTVSLPVNIHITKTGLQKGESAKFRIERADLPDEGPVDYTSLEWTYVSTVFVTKSAGTTGDPIVKVKGLPANRDVPTGETVVVDGEEKPVTVQKNLVYRITEENWAWSYEIKTAPMYTNTLNITNPFTFKNEKKENIEVIIRHAESKATNVFKPNVVTGNVRYDDSKTNTRP